MQAAAVMLFLFLPTVIVAAGAVIGTLVVREAFAPASLAKRQERAGAALPLLGGDALRRWGSALAQRIAGDRLQRRASRQTAIALAHELEDEATQVIERSLPSIAAVREPQCSDCSAQTIHVTVPETLAIVDELRQNASSHELRRVRDRARRNVEQMSRESTDASASTCCPLLSDDHRCAAFAARPLSCRGRCCPNCDQAAETRSTTESDSPRLFAVTFGEGISAGLSQELTKAGLDGRSYELNRALTQALDVPDAADRWLRGETVFEACGI